MINRKIYYGVFTFAVIVSVTLFFGFAFFASPKNLNVCADATSNTYTIQFDTSDWEGIKEITAYEGGSVVTKTATDPIEYTYVDGDPSVRVYLYNLVIDGYDFAGWYVSSLDTARYDREVGFYYIDSSLKSNLTLYADFTAISYHISYFFKVKIDNVYENLDNVTNKNSNKYTTDEGIVFKKAEKEGYTFVGWYTDEDLTLPIEEIEPGIIGDCVVYGKFEIQDCKLSYAYGGYEDVELKYGEEITEEMLPTPTRNGYTFEGWYTTMGFVKQIEAGYAIDGDITLYPKWKKIENPIWKPLTFGGMGLCLVLAGVWLIVFKGRKTK